MYSKGLGFRAYSKDSGFRVYSKGLGWFRVQAL